MIIDINLIIMLLNITFPRLAASLPMYKYINVVRQTIKHPMINKRLCVIDTAFSF